MTTTSDAAFARRGKNSEVPCEHEVQDDDDGIKLIVDEHASSHFSDSRTASVTTQQSSTDEDVAGFEDFP
ncbi:unnamed protein product, partial [Amoebophrya sp. A120]|eukprot:GSA120T00011601001.1